MRSSKSDLPGFPQNTPNYCILPGCFQQLLKVFPGMQDFPHHGPADITFQSIGIHLPLHRASGGIIPILDDSSPFVRLNLTSINMTTQAGKGTTSNLQLLPAGWCDRGRRGRALRSPDVSHVPRINMHHTSAHSHNHHKLFGVKFRIKTN